MTAAPSQAHPAPGVVLSTDLPGVETYVRGKVRDVYDLDYHLLIVATDRISAFDVVLPTGIPDKGRVLTQLSTFWFEAIHNLCPSHWVASDLDQIQDVLTALGIRAPDALLAGRSMLVARTRALPVECVVRGYLDGSAWKEYLATQSVCGIPLPQGLKQGSRLPEPIFTPAAKAKTGHDENITHAQMSRLVEPGIMKQMIEKSLAVYRFAAEYAEPRGILVADAKFEFGIFQEGLVMIDECLTPDSSRFWDAGRWKPGGPQVGFDKQFVRDYLDRTGWNHEPPGPALPAEVVEQTSARYREIFTRLTDYDLE